MKNTVILAAVVVVAAGSTGFWLGTRHVSKPPASTTLPVAGQSTAAANAFSDPQETNVSPVQAPPSSPALGASLPLITEVLGRDIEFSQYHGAFTLAHGADIATIEAYLATAFAWPDIHASIGVSRILLGRLVMLDAKRGLALALHQVQARPSHRRLLFDYFHEWAVADAAGALAGLAAITDNELRLSLSRALAADPVLHGQPVLARWLTEQPDAVRRAAVQAENRRESPAVVFSRLMSGSSVGNVRRQLASVLMRWARTDPQAAVAAVLNEAKPHQQQQWLPMLLSRWAVQDVNAAWQQALALDRGNGEMLEAVLNGLVRQDPPRALAMAEQHRNRLASHVVEGLLRNWSFTDARAAVDYWQSQGDQDPQMAASIAQGYVRQYPVEAFAWAEQFNLDGTTLSNMAMVFAEEYPHRAQRYLDDTPQGAIRGALLENLAAQQSRRDGRQAYQWLRQYAGEPNYQKAEQRVVLEWIRQDPADAASLVSTLDLERRGGVFLSSLVNNWYAREPQAIANWVLALPIGPGRDRALQQLIIRVSRQDSSWARRLSDEISDEQLLRQVRVRLDARKSG